ncbi:MAG TPA: prepilin-type N-terminal cleavage/methylation domain-containing protein [Candidatus Saccharimonadales bacterium]|nr:prepilin-type N-terminal cleavage/methylation domain-containing protein [Candidatus Saccharimonadales bacterium]
MKRLQTQRGFALVELLLILVIVGIIAFVAWRVIDASGEVDNAQNMVPTSTAVFPGGVAEPTSSSDLGNLENQLNNTQIDDSTSTEIDTETTF